MFLGNFTLQNRKYYCHEVSEPLSASEQREINGESLIGLYFLMSSSDI